MVKLYDSLDRSIPQTRLFNIRDKFYDAHSGVEQPAPVAPELVRVYLDPPTPYNLTMWTWVENGERAWGNEEQAKTHLATL